MKNRRATSLVELLVVMSACSVILTLSAAMLHRAMHIQSRSRAYLETERNAARLSQQFRSDVHRASDHRTGGDEAVEGMLVELTHPGDEVVKYAGAGGTVSRSLSRVGAVVSREEYSFPPAINVEIQEEDAPDRLVLTITSEPSKESRRAENKRLDVEASPVGLHVEAVLDRDQRHVLMSAVREGTP